VAQVAIWSRNADLKLFLQRCGRGDIETKGSTDVDAVDRVDVSCSGPS